MTDATGGTGATAAGPSPGRPASSRRRGLILLALALVALLVVVLIVTLVHRSSGTVTGQPSSSSSPSSVPSSSSSSSPTRTGTCKPESAVNGTPTAAEQTLLAGRVGFGGQVTGGAGAQIVHVSTDADDGPGSLRAAVSSSTPAWVVFDKDMTIKLTKPLAVCSNKTIDGQGRKVEITGHGVEGLDLIGVSNVIIVSLTLHDFGDTAKTKDNNTPDAIHMDQAHGVWIDHCDLSMAGDKLIAVSDGSTAITVSWNHLHDQVQTFQIGNQNTAKADSVITVTIHHNFFDHTGYRNPVLSYGRAHAFDNYYLDWDLYAVRSERAGQLYLEDNIFAAGTRTRATTTTPQGDGCNDAKTRCDDRPGYLKSVGNLALNKAKIKESSPNLVFDPSQFYKYAAEPASQALANRIATLSGPGH